MDATFILSNAAPQVSKFNSGEWKDFEALQRSFLDDIMPGVDAYIIVGTMGFNHQDRSENFFPEINNFSLFLKNKKIRKSVRYIRVIFLTFSPHKDWHWK